MSASPQAARVPVNVWTPSWSFLSRTAFQFCFLYFGLFCLACQILGGLFPIPVDGIDIPDLSTPLRPVVFWTAAHVFQAKPPLVFQGSGSGDKTFDWVLAFCLIVIAAVATAVWSVLDKRPNYTMLSKWFRIFIRFALAGQMFTYGFVKAVPLQMSFPSLTQLLEPYGNFSPMGVLWSSVGASPSYEMFTGCVEIITGVLLIFPRTTMLGALLCLVDSVEIFTLNMTYDVPVKLFAFHLILLSLYLLAPDLKRLGDVFVFNRAVLPSTTLPTFDTRKASRIAFITQIVFGLWLLGNSAYGARHGWFQYGGGSSKSPLYGIWDVDQMSVDNQIRLPLLNDYGRWQHVIFDYPKAMTFQRMDSSFARYVISTDSDHKAIALTKNSDKKWKAHFSFDRKTPDQMTLDGNMDDHKVHMQLKLMDRNKFILVSRGFHWVQEYPFNR